MVPDMSISSKALPRNMLFELLSMLVAPGATKSALRILLADMAMDPALWICTGKALGLLRYGCSGPEAFARLAWPCHLHIQPFATGTHSR